MNTIKIIEEPIIIQLTENMLNLEKRLHQAILLHYLLTIKSKRNLPLHETIEILLYNTLKL